MPWAVVVAAALKGASDAAQKGQDETDKMVSGNHTPPPPTQSTMPAPGQGPMKVTMPNAPDLSKVGLVAPSATPNLTAHAIGPTSGLMSPQAPQFARPANLDAPPGAGLGTAPPDPTLLDKIRQSKVAQGLMGFMQGATGADY